MSGTDFSLQDEVLKSIIGEVTSLAFPGLQTALRFAVATGVNTRNGDSMERALREALAYRFALAPSTATERSAAPEPDTAPKPDTAAERDATIEPDTAAERDATIEPDTTAEADATTERDATPRIDEKRWPRLFPKTRQKRKMKKAEKEAREEGRRMATVHGLNVPALLAASAEGSAVATEDLQSIQSRTSIEGVLVPLQIVRSELAYATRPVVPPPHGWRRHIAEALTSAAVAGVGSGDARQRHHWEQLLRHSLGISDNFAIRAPDWGRLVAAAFEYEMRRAEDDTLGLSAQLDRADVASQVQDLARTAGLAHRSLSRLAFFAGVLAFAGVAATVLYAMSLVT